MSDAIAYTTDVSQEPWVSSRSSERNTDNADAHIGVDFFYEKGGCGVERGMGTECSPPQRSRLEGLGERGQLPQRGPGKSPGRKRVLVHSELERTHVMVTTSLVFLAGGTPT